MNWTNGEHAMALKEERERVQREMSIELADWQASSEAYRLDAEAGAAEIERLRGIEDAAINAASYFHLGGRGEEDFDPQRMHDLMVKLGRALEPTTSPLWGLSLRGWHRPAEAVPEKLTRAALEPKP